MPKSLSHEEIAQKFIDTKAVDFGAIGRFITDLGPTLAVNDQGLHGVVIGRYNTIACMIPALDLGRLVGNLRVAGATTSALEAPGPATMGV